MSRRSSEPSREATTPRAAGATPRSFRAPGKSDTRIELSLSSSKAHLASPVYNTERYCAILGESFPADTELHLHNLRAGAGSGGAAAGSDARSAAAPPTLQELASCSGGDGGEESPMDLKRQAFKESRKQLFKRFDGQIPGAEPPSTGTPATPSDAERDDRVESAGGSGSPTRAVSPSSKWTV